MFRGTIAFFCGDNLGSQFIGGFKEGSRAHRVCRECMDTQIQISICVSVKKVASIVLLWTAFDIYTLVSGKGSPKIWSSYANFKSFISLEMDCFHSL
jgi:hypothetical protein